jgi:hypothetical protein
MQISDKDINMDDGRFFDADRENALHAGDVQQSSGTHRIEIAFVKYGHSGTTYRVMYRDKILIEKTKEPLFSACRALVAIGLRGRLEEWAGESYPRVIVRDIEQAAKLAVVENVNDGPRFARYRPHPGIIDGDDGE